MNVTRWIVALGWIALPPLAVAQQRNYVEHVRPILAGRCLGCHNADNSRGGLDLSSYQATMNGGSGGEVLAPGDPQGSRLYELVAHLAEPKMPPNGARIPDNELAVFRAWIEQGLRETSSSAAVKPKAVAGLEMGDLDSFVPSDGEIFPLGLPLDAVVPSSPHGSVARLATHPWSPLAFLAGQRQVQVYDLEQNELLGVLPLDNYQPEVLRVAHQGKLLLVGSGIAGQTGQVELWSLEEGTRLASLGEEYDSVRAADMDARQRWVALGGPSRVVRVLSIETGEVLHQIRKHTDWITAVAFSPDGILLATADRNGGVHVWEAETGAPFYSLGGHRGSVTSLAWRADSDVLATGCADGRIRLWNMHNGRQIRAFNAHPPGVLDVAFARDGRLLTGGREKQARLWKPDGKKLKDLPTRGQLVTSVAFDNTGKQALTTSFRGGVEVFDLATAKRRAEIQHALPTANDRQQTLHQAQKTLQEELQQLATQQQTLAAQEAQANAQLQTFEQNVRAAQQAQEQAKADIAQVAEAVAAAERAVQQAQQAHTSDSAAATAHAAEVAKADADHASHAKAHEELLQALDVAYAKQAELESAAVANPTERACLHNEAAAHVSALHTLLERSTSRLHAIDEARKALREQQEVWTATVATRTTALEQAQQGLQEQQSQRTGRDAALTQADAAHSQAVQQRDQQRQTAANLVAQREATTVARNRLEQQRERNSGLLAKWQAGALRTRLDAQRQTLAELDADLRPLRKQIVEAQAAADAASAAHAAAEKRLAGLPAERTGLETALQELQTEQTQCQAQIETAAARHVAKQEQRKQVADDLRSLIEAAEREPDNPHLQAAAAQVTTLLESLDRDEQDAGKTHAQLVQKYETLRSNSAAKQQALQALADAEAALPGEIAQRAQASETARNVVIQRRQELEAAEEPRLLAEADLQELQEEYDAYLMEWLAATGR